MVEELERFRKLAELQEKTIKELSSDPRLLQQSTTTATAEETDALRDQVIELKKALSTMKRQNTMLEKKVQSFANKTVSSSAKRKD